MPTAVSNANVNQALARLERARADLAGLDGLTLTAVVAHLRRIWWERRAALERDMHNAERDLADLYARQMAETTEAGLEEGPGADALADVERAIHTLYAMTELLEQARVHLRIATGEVPSPVLLERGLEREARVYCRVQAARHLLAAFNTRLEGVGAVVRPVVVAEPVLERPGVDLAGASAALPEITERLGLLQAELLRLADARRVQRR